MCGKQIGRTDELIVIIVHTYNTKSLKYCCYWYSDLLIFQFGIDFFIFLVTVLHTSGWTILKFIGTQKLLQIYHVNQEWAKGEVGTLEPV